MNILLAINNLDTGGAESFVCRLARQLAENNHHVFVWQVFYPKKQHQFIGELQHPNIHPFYFEQKKVDCLVKKPKSLLASIYRRKLQRNIIKKKIDIVNSHLFEADCFVHENLKLPQVISMHGSYEMYLNNEQVFKRDSIYKAERYLQLSTKILSACKAVVIITPKNEQIFSAAIRPKNVRKIYNGFKRKIASKGIADFLRIGMLARGIPDKGWEIAINACLKVKKDTGNPFTLTLGYTVSDYMNSLRIKYKDFDWIEWKENVTDLSSFFNQIDLFLFPTQYPAESLPNVVIESLAYDVPVIGTDIGEIKKMLVANIGEAGITFSENLSKNELIRLYSEELTKILEEPRRLELYKSKCASAFEKFNIIDCTEKYVEIYNAALK